MENKIKPKDSDSFLGKFPLLTPENIDEIEKEIEEDPTYGKKANGGELNRFFKDDKYKYNTNHDIVIHKILLIDYTNSTQLQRHKRDLSIFTLANRIIQIRDLDKRIESGDLNLVAELANQAIIQNNDKSSRGSTKTSKREHINLFSFATKYCLYHNRISYGHDHYSIYDRVVADAIPHYLHDIKKDDIEQFRKEADYKSFHYLITRIINENGLGQIDFIRRKLDHFLWYPNKLSFYSKNKNKKKEKDVSSSSADLFANNND